MRSQDFGLGGPDVAKKSVDPFFTQQTQVSVLFVYFLQKNYFLIQLGGGPRTPRSPLPTPMSCRVGLILFKIRYRIIDHVIVIIRQCMGYTGVRRRYQSMCLYLLYIG